MVNAQVSVTLLSAENTKT